MFEARLAQGKILKQIIESIKDLVAECNFDCNEEEFTAQSMDASHVALVAVRLGSDAFEHWRCDRPNTLGISTANFSKIFKMMNNDDSLTLKAEDDADGVTMMFEGQKNDIIADFELKLMDIDNEQLGIPDTPYKCTVQMPSREFERIVRDLQVLGETCTISCSKEGVRFGVEGGMGNGRILLRSNATAEKEKDRVVVTMEEPVELNFALRYLNFFTKATSLSDSVTISMSPEVPILVEYPIEDFGYVKYYLAPKIEEE